MLVGQRDLAGPQLKGRGLGFGAPGHCPSALAQGPKLRAIARREFIRRSRALCQSGQHGALPRSAASAGRIELRPSCVGQSPDVGNLVGRLAGAQRRGKRRRNDFTDGVVVVLRSPAQQFEGDRVEHRNFVEPLQGGLELGGGNRGVLRQADQNPDQLPTPEGDSHPYSGSQDRGGPVAGRQIIERATQRSIERYLQDQGGPLVHNSCG